MSKQITVTVDDGTAALVDAIVRQSGGSLDVPTLSKADVYRLLLMEGACRLLVGEIEHDVHNPDLAEQVDAETLRDLVPDHAKARFLVETLDARVPEGMEDDR